MGDDEEEESSADRPDGQSWPEDSGHKEHDEALDSDEQHRHVTHHVQHNHCAVLRQNVEPVLKHATKRCVKQMTSVDRF